MKHTFEGGGKKYSFVKKGFIVNKIFFYFMFILIIPTLSAENSSFLVQEPQKRLSKNDLKENIGEELKQSLFTCASLANELGTVQRELAKLQKRLLAKVENLLENDRCFKKASRSELSSALKTMNAMQCQLRLQEQNIKRLLESMEKNVCLKDKQAS